MLNKGDCHLYGLSFFSLNVKQQYFYKRAMSIIAESELLIPACELCADDINKVLRAVLNDHPEFFWFKGKWTLDEFNGKRYAIPYYIFDKIDIYEIQKIIDESVKKSCGAITGSITCEKIRKLYDWILDNVDYGTYDNSDGQTIYDALVCKKAVCKGLSKSMQYLSERVNCFSALREGSLDGISKHIWNIVRIDGKYYNVDVSMGYSEFSFLFDLCRQIDRYRCFLVSDKTLSKTHQINILQYPVVCNDEYIGE